MNYLLAEGITKIYGDKVLFENLHLSINKGQKIALIAKNGIGKTSLLRILVGLESSDAGGTVRVNKDIRRGYLPQEPDLDPEHTVLESIFNTDNPVLSAIHQYENALLKNELHPTPESQASLEKAMEKMQLHDAWDYEAKVKEILGRFSITMYDRKIGTLSGGERKRVAMAGVLIQNPDLIIMDEPTNHLDMAMIEWLEVYFAKNAITLLLVTHDRYFMNNITDEILELENGTVQKYRGNYEYYLEKKAEQQENLKVEVGKHQKLMKKELQWIRTQPKARGTKSKSRITAFDGIQDKANQKLGDDDVSFDGIKMSRIGGKTIEILDIDKEYGDKVLLHNFTYIFKRRDRVGIVGNNGAGKSTFLNILVGNERPTRGRVVKGQTVVFGYYTQKGMNFKDNKKVIDVVRDIAEVLPLEKGKYYTAAQMLDHFMFPYSKHQNYVSTLSGGEKRRLYLLTILMKNPNFLILDEPTNDLDILTLNVLEDFLSRFNGCLVIVSHDRYFMDKLVDHVFVFEGKGEGKVRDYPGNYSRYREQKSIEEKAEKAARDAQKAAESNVDKTATYANRQRKLSYKEQREFDDLEKEIAQHEAEKEALEAKLNTGEGSYEDMAAWAEKIGELIALIDEKTDRWMELSE